MSQPQLPPIPPEYKAPAVVHRVLLWGTINKFSGSHNFDPLTGQPRQEPFAGYGDFAAALDGSSRQHSNVETIIKAAFRDHLVERLQSRNDNNQGRRLQPAIDLLLQLHHAMRQLIPNRPDLHDQLGDEEEVAQQASNLARLLQCVQAAAVALEHLESEARASSTTAWRQEAATRASSNHIDATFVITSLLFLHHKVETCQHDKQDFYFWTLWAPQLRRDGLQLERQHFASTYGRFGDPQSAPATRQWIATLVQQSGPTTRASLATNSTARQTLVQRGWMETLLFRHSAAGPVHLPEIFVHDADMMQQIRQVTKVAAAGCALALQAQHWAAAANGGITKMVPTHQHPDEWPANLRLRRTALVDALADNVGTTQLQYEQNVAGAVLALVQELKSTSSSEQQQQQPPPTLDTVIHTTRKVLASHDPVLQLLQARMKECFADIVTRHDRGIPDALRTGGATASAPASPARQPRVARPPPRHHNAVQVFCQRGLAFYAIDLAQAAMLATNVVILAWTLFSDVLLEQLVLRALDNLPADDE